jgi:hypothetical protein
MEPGKLPPRTLFMRRSTFLIAVPAAIAVALLSQAPVRAQLTTFASVDTIGQVFRFANSGGTSTFGLISASIPVTFKYKVDNGHGGINVDIAATMTLTANVTNGPLGYFQDMSGVSMAITANTPVRGLTNLLSMGATGQLTSAPNSNIANFGGDTSNSQLVGFTSDFLDFSNTTDRSFNFALNSLTPRASLNGNGYLNTFTAAGLGNFASDPAPLSSVPEPSALGLLGLAALPALSLRRRATR